MYNALNVFFSHQLWEAGFALSAGPTGNAPGPSVSLDLSLYCGQVPPCNVSGELRIDVSCGNEGTDVSFLPIQAIRKPGIWGASLRE